MDMSKQQWFSNMRLVVLAVLLATTLCQAEHECQNPKEITEDFTPVFDFGENWSFKDCGVWSNREVAAPWRVAVSRTDGATCFGILLSNFDFVTSECKEVADDFRKEPSGVKAYSGTCYDQKVKSTDAPSANCTGLEVVGVAALGKDSDETQLHLWRLKAAAPDTKPICLFNANQKQKAGYVDSDYAVVDRKWKGRIEAQVGGAPRTSQPSTLCVKIGRSQSTADKHDFSGDFLVKEVGGRMTLRGFFFWPVAEHKIFVYTDVVPFIKELVANSHNMFIMPDVPLPRTKTDFKKAPTLNIKGECGVATAVRRVGRSSDVREPIDHILGGTRAEKGAYPWHASISHFPPNAIEIFDVCGATLISNRCVVTAAHCVYDHTHNRIRASDLSISLGMHDLADPSSTAGQQHIGVEKIVVHPDYNRDWKMFDVALLFLEEEVNGTTKHVRPICLWDDDYSLDILKDQLGTVVGWGFTEYAHNESRHRPDILLEGHMSVLDHRKCYVKEKVFYRKFLHPGVTFCASGFNDTQNKNVAACQGDSGGSFIIHKDNAWYLRGVVSFGVTKFILNKAGTNEATCNEDYPSLYVDLGSCMDWIVQQVVGAV